MSKIVYRGIRTPSKLRVVVDTIDDENAHTDRVMLAPRTELANHSPAGLECGYEGSGPAQLALAICADHLTREALRASSAAISLDEEFDGPSADRVALLVHQTFKRRVIAGLPRDDGWSLSSERVAKEIDAIVADLVKIKRARAGVS